MVKKETKCPRVEMRMECPECGYPYSEAKYALDERVPHKGGVAQLGEHLPCTQKVAGSIPVASK